MLNKFLLGEKIGMTQYITEAGEVLPVTVLRVGPCQVLKLTPQSDKESVTLLMGFDEKVEKKCNRPEMGIFKGLNTTPKKVVREVSVKANVLFSEGMDVTSSLFSVEEKVNVRGVSIGKGFAGTIKRHNFSRGPRSHGSKNYRAPGSIGAGTTPGRVLKGKRMAGHMGDAKVTVKNLRIVCIDTEHHYVFVKGAVPGKRNAKIEVFN